MNIFILFYTKLLWVSRTANKIENNELYLSKRVLTRFNICFWLSCVGTRTFWYWGVNIIESNFSFKGALEFP